MAAVLFHAGDICTVDDDWIEIVKRNAEMEPLRRARLNMHHSEDDQVQEMVIAFCRDSLNPPHRHLGKTESLHALEGRALICFFDNEGTVTEKVVIGGPGHGLPPLYRLSAPRWHTVVPLDDMVVVHEVAMGPFRRVQDFVPGWMPVGESVLRAFIDRLIEDFASPSASAIAASRHG